jgi:signal transduction histidine kinase
VIFLLDSIFLCVTDTGTGMTADLIAQAFDPFFTTKPIGQGTGRAIYSEVGKGTTMCLYFPRVFGDNVESNPPEAKTHVVILNID